MLDPDKMLSTINSLVRAITGTSMPHWVTVAVAAILLLCLALLGVRWVLRLVVTIIELCRTQLLPYFYDPTNARRSRRRRQFADYMVGELQRLARKEEWKDYRFTDLEAEVEVEILQGGLNLRELLSRYRGGLSRERS